MKSFNILGVHRKIQVLGQGRVTKNHYIGKIVEEGGLVSLQGSWQERGRWCFEGPNAHYEQPPNSWLTQKEKIGKEKK